MKTKQFIILFTLFISSSSPASLLSIAPLQENTKSFKAGVVNTYDKKEYERDEISIDKITEKGNAAFLDYSWSFSKKVELAVRLDYLLGGDFKEVYSEELASVPNKQTDTSGIKEPLLRARKWFDHNLSPNLTQGMEVSYRPKFFEPKASDFAEGRHVLTLNYLFSHAKNNFEIAGDIYTRIYSKRELELPDGLVDETQSYSEAGFILTPGLFFNKNSTHLILGYSSTTDYNTTNPLYNRESDKGFTWHYGIKHKQKLSKDNFLELSALLKTTTFNSIEEDPTRNVEYKIFERYIGFNWSTSL